MRGTTATVLATAILLGACGGQAPRPAKPSAGSDHRPAALARQTPSGTSTTPVATTRTTTTTAPATPRRLRRHRYRPADVGRLPQTPQRPPSATAGFRSEMAALWRGIRRDSLRAALPAFFPKAAYLQLKAIADPAGDWHERLLGGYGLDIAAAHELLGAGASRARLLRVIVPSGLAHWVPPGVCSNRVGYWETPNSRLVYAEAGQTRSFGIASMISWRGIWFVVHLGAVIRPDGSGGLVDNPAAGEGYAAPSSTC